MRWVPALRFEFFDVRRDSYPDRIEDCDGYLITGSRASVYDDEPWIARLKDFTRELNDAPREDGWNLLWTPVGCGSLGRGCPPGGCGLGCRRAHVASRSSRNRGCAPT